MYDLLFFIVLISLGLMFVLHLLSIGSPYVSSRWFNGHQQYEVWIRRFLGYNHLAGSFYNEEDAYKLLGQILEQRRN